MKNYYEVLKIQDYSDLEEIKQAYKKLATQYHPDKHEGNSLKDLADEKIKELNEAYAHLKTEPLKRQYDEKLKKSRNSTNEQDTYRNSKDNKNSQSSYNNDDNNKYEKSNHNYNYNYNYSHSYKEKYTETKYRKSCIIHPKENADYVCNSCYKPICKACYYENINNMCSKCLETQATKLKKEFRTYFLHLLPVLVVMTILVFFHNYIDIYPLYVYYIILFILTGIAFNSKDIFKDTKHALKSRSPFSLIISCIGLLFSLLLSTLTLLPKLITNIVGLISVQKKYKALRNKRSNRMLFTTCFLSCIFISALFLPLITSYISKEVHPVIQNGITYRIQENQVLKLAINNRNTEGVKGTYIESIDKPYNNILKEGLYLNGTIIELTLEDNIYYLKILGSMKDSDGSIENLNSKSKLTIDTTLKFDMCNDYVDVYSQGQFINTIDQVTNEKWLNHLKHHRIEISIR